MQAVILTDDNVDGKLKSISAELVASKAPLEEELLLQKIVNLPFDAILTTNYTYELEKAICNDFSITQKSGKDFECRSWIDYFLIGNITIIGLGMDFSEFDLWWLVNAKKRRFPNTHTIFYKPDITYEQELLAQIYGVTVMRECSNSGFKVYYSTLIKKLSR